MPKLQISPRRAAAVTAVLALLSVFPPLATDMYLAAIGVLAEDMNASHAATELSLSLFFLGLCAGQLVMGPLIDGYGRKGPLLIGVSVFIATSVALVLTEDIVLFNVLRFFQAVGACAGMIVGRAVVNDLYQGQQAAKAMTVLVMLMTIGPVISPTLGSLLLTSFGWRSIFVTMVAVGVLALVLSKLVIPETLPREGRVARPFGAARLGAGSLLARRGFIVPVLVAGLVQGGMFAFITGSSGVFQGVFGLDALSYGLVFAAVAAALFIFGQVNNRLLDHFTPAQILTRGLPVYALAALGAVILSGTGLLLPFVAALWMTIGMVGLLSANAMSLAMAAAREGAGLGSALLGAVQFGLAFTVSSSVALGGTDTALPMTLGLLIPAVLAATLWAGQLRALPVEAAG
ncbi:multidrug effflux MFS transporter [Rhodobacteraceae bacterium NNCM2]|nr:multidrug effflux MFS transporter [Coraliihabitans acroporae]